MLKRPKGIGRGARRALRQDPRLDRGVAHHGITIVEQQPAAFDQGQPRLSGVARRQSVLTCRHRYRTLMIVKALYRGL